jgi:hypothetical protein
MKSRKRKTGIPKLSRNERAPATCLAREFRSPDDYARMQRVAEGSLIEPVDTDINEAAGSPARRAIFKLRIFCISVPWEDRAKSMHGSNLSTGAA